MCVSVGMVASIALITKILAIIIGPWCYILLGNNR